MQKTSIAFFFFCLSIIILPLEHLQAQSSEVLPQAHVFYQNAQKELRVGNYQKAIRYAQDATRVSGKFVEAFILLGTAYQKAKRYKESINSYKRALHLEYRPEIEYRVAESYLWIEDYTLAKKHYTQYLKSNPRSRKIVSKVKKRLKSCDFAIKAIKNPVPFQPINLRQLNSKDSEYNPFVSVDESFMIYTKMIRTQGRLQEDFYISYKTVSGWGPGTPLMGAINSPDNEGGHSISISGKEMYLTACNRKGGLGSCDIYVSYFSKEGWSAPQNLGALVNSPGWDAHPSISPDGKKLYFSSDRPGGKGKKDIWVSTRNYQGWTKPVPLDILNSSGNEVSPYIHPDNHTLYFSSDGFEGMGSKDLFLSRKSNQIWGNPMNLGYKINSIGEEYSIFVDRGGVKAYIATDNIPGGTGGLDIYSFALQKSVAPLPVVYLQGKVIDKKGYIIRDAKLAMYNAKTKESLDIEINQGFFYATLPIDQVYGMQVYSKGYILYSDVFDFDKERTYSSRVKKDVVLTEIKKDRKIRLKNINFKSNESQLYESSYMELDNLAYFLKSQPEVKIQVNGYTDDIGDQSFNMKLSIKRAQSVVQYLTSKGIDPKRLKYKGFGESAPAHSNEEEEGRSKNRRIEIVML